MKRELQIQLSALAGVKLSAKNLIVTVVAALWLAATCFCVAAPDPGDHQFDQLMRHYRVLQDEAAHLAAARTLEEQFMEVRRVLGEVCETMEQTGKDSQEVAEKIQMLANAVRRQHAGLRELLLGVGSGMRRTGQSAKEVADTVKMLDDGMAFLEGAVRARNMNSAMALQEFGKYFGSLTRLAKPLLDRIPVLGTFVDIWSRAITAIASDVARIERERDRRQRLARELTGRELYLIPRTERENLGLRHAAKMREIDNVERELRTRFAHRVERIGNRYQPKEHGEVDMERERAMAARSVSHLSQQIERVSADRGRAHSALDRARAARRAAANAFNERDAAMLAAKLGQLTRLGPEVAYRDPVHATDEVRRRAREEWFQRRETRSRLMREIQPLEFRKKTLADATQTLRSTEARWHEVDTRYKELEAARTALMRRHMLEKARQHKWAMADLRRKYPELF